MGAQNRSEVVFGEMLVAPSDQLGVYEGSWSLSPPPPFRNVLQNEVFGRWKGEKCEIEKREVEDVSNENLFFFEKLNSETVLNN